MRGVTGSIECFIRVERVGIFSQIGTARFRLFLTALIAMSTTNRSVVAVQVNSAADSVQQKDGCSGATAKFCDLRVYQIMVEAFVDGDSARNYNAGYGTSHHKGDLKGITNSLDYIKGLGMNAIWMTPIFDSYAGQPREGGGVDLKLDATGYYARDYFKIDPKFGSLADAQTLVAAAHQKGLYVFFDGVFGHHKGNLVPSPTGKLPVNSSPGVANYSSQQTLDFYKEVATYWINQLGIDGWRLDQSYQVPPSAWRSIRSAVEDASAQRTAAGQQWGTLGYMVAEDWSDAYTMQSRTFGSDANPILHSAFDFPLRYALVGVLAGEESGLSGRPPAVINESWAYGAHGDVYADHALPNLMLGNHDLVRFGDLLQRADIAGPAQSEYWARHRLAFMAQAAYSGPITRYYGEEIGDEVPSYANRVTTNCANLGLCDDHVARTSGKILGVTVTSGQLSANQHALLDFHEELMAVRSEYLALSHGSRQHLYSDDNLYIDLKTHGDQQIVFAMNTSNQAAVVDINASLFGSLPAHAWDILNSTQVDFTSGYLSFTLAPLSARYVLLAENPLLKGDFNRNGVVDASDYVAWRKGLASDYSPDDFNTWRARFGESAAPGLAPSASVPEPPSVLLCIVCALAIVMAARFNPIPVAMPAAKIISRRGQVRSNRRASRIFTRQPIQQ